jgi:hypothetical protein
MGCGGFEIGNKIRRDSFVVRQPANSISRQNLRERETISKSPQEFHLKELVLLFPPTSFTYVGISIIYFPPKLEI